MANEVIYHGSTRIIENPTASGSAPFNDFGLGFYCTKNPALAREWACSDRTNGYVNKYNLELAGLEVLNIPDSEVGTLTWTAILLQNRNFRISSEKMKAGVDWLLDRYYVNLGNYDVIAAPRADDSYFSFVRAFLSGEISLTQLSAALKLDKDSAQYVLRSDRAINHLEFMSFAPAEASSFYARRKSRDAKVRRDFLKMIAGQAADAARSNWLYIGDIVEQEVTARDLLLR